MNSFFSFFTVPNILTTLRGLFTIPLVYFILIGNVFWSLAVVLLALLTEFDGTIARKLNQTSKFGAMYDPFVDGTFCFSGLVSLLYMGKLPLPLIGLLFLANVPRLVFMYLFQKRDGKFNSTKASKISGLLVFFMIPLGIIGFVYLDWFIIVTIVFTLYVQYKNGMKYFEK